MIHLLLLGAMFVDPNVSLPPGDSTRTIEVHGRTRSYVVHVPKSYDRSKPVAVVLAFHGGGTNAQSMIRFCGLNDTADEAGFLAVYPEGTGRRENALVWNAGDCCGYAMRRNVDDVAFVDALLDELEAQIPIDSKRIYATGMSNGAMLTYRLASELSHRIAAIAPVAGPMGSETCHPERPVSVLHFHGTADEFAPFEGGRGQKSLSRTEFRSVEHSIDAWVKANGCSEMPEVVELPNHVGDETSVTRKTYGHGKDGAEVVLVVIDGGGHTWPGRQPRLRILGRSTGDISANEMMWSFFVKHPMK